MKNDYPRPKWLILYLIVAIFLYLLWRETRAPLSEAYHVWAGVGLILLLYGSLLWWLKANDLALMMEHRNRGRGADRPAPAWLIAVLSYLCGFFQPPH